MPLLPPLFLGLLHLRVNFQCLQQSPLPYSFCNILVYSLCAEEWAPDCFYPGCSTSPIQEQKQKWEHICSHSSKPFLQPWLETSQEWCWRWTTLTDSTCWCLLNLSTPRCIKLAVLQIHHTTKRLTRKWTREIYLSDKEKPIQKPNTSYEILLQVWRVLSLSCATQYQESLTENLTGHFLI